MVSFDDEPFLLSVVSLSGAPSTYDVTAAICRAFCLPPNELRWDLEFQYGPREHWPSAQITVVLALGYHEAIDLALALAGRELAEQQPDIQWLVITPTAIHHHAPEFLQVARPSPAPVPAA
jgi:hypothetical protein